MKTQNKNESNLPITKGATPQRRIIPVKLPLTEKEKEEREKQEEKDKQEREKDPKGPGGTHPDLIFMDASTAYIQRNRMKHVNIHPDRHSSTVDSDRVYLRKNGYLLAIYELKSREFMSITPELIKKHSK